MKFTINNNDFREGLKIVSKAVPKRTTIDALRGVLIKALENCVELNAFDMGTHIQISVPASIEEEGSSLVPFAELFGFVSKSTKEIDVEDHGNYILLTSSGEIKLNTYPLKDYPPLPPIPEDFTCQVFNLKDKIKNTVFLTTLDASDYRSGVFFGNNRVIAYDGNYRVGSVSCDLDINPMLIPSKLLYNMITWDNAYIQEDGRRVYFKKDNIVLSSPRINYPFPKMENMFLVEYKINIYLDRELLLKICETANSINQKTFVLNIRENIVEVTAKSEIGFFKEIILLDEVVSDNISLSLKPQDIISLLKGLSDIEEGIVLHVNEPRKMIKFSSGNYEYLTMPQVSII